MLSIRMNTSRPCHSDVTDRLFDIIYNTMSERLTNATMLFIAIPCHSLFYSDYICNALRTLCTVCAIYMHIMWPKNIQLSEYSSVIYYYFTNDTL